MAPEVWEAIRRDWRESLPAVLAGEDDKFYMDGWARRAARPRTVKGSFHYLCRAMGWDVGVLRSVRKDGDVPRQRDAICMALWRSHNTSHTNLGKALNRHHSSMASILKRGKWKCDHKPEFADLVRRLECLLT